MICIAILCICIIAISHLLEANYYCWQRRIVYSRSHILSLKWSCGMLDKSPDIQSYLICFGSNHIFLSGRAVACHTPPRTGSSSPTSAWSCRGSTRARRASTCASPPTGSGKGGARTSSWTSSVRLFPFLFLSQRSFYSVFIFIK